MSTKRERIAARIRESLSEENPDAILFDGLDGALIGTGRQWGMSEVAVYDEALLIEELIKIHGDYESAIDWYGHNVECLYAGPGTPIIIRKPDLDT